MRPRRPPLPPQPVILVLWFCWMFSFLAMQKDVVQLLQFLLARAARPARVLHSLFWRLELTVLDWLVSLLPHNQHLYPWLPVRARLSFRHWHGQGVCIFSQKTPKSNFLPRLLFHQPFSDRLSEIVHIVLLVPRMCLVRGRRPSSDTMMIEIIFWITSFSITSDGFSSGISTMSTS